MTSAERTNSTLRRRTVLAAIAAIGVVGAATVRADPVDLRVVDRETGQILPLWRHHGRLYVAGQPGSRYSLRVTNHTDGRILVVMSVDGVNILTGETAGYGQGGYVFGPYQSYDVSGWRKSTTEVAAFAFARLSQSYAARTGRPGDVGVIGMAVFTEKVETPDYAPSIGAEGRNEPEMGASGGHAYALQRAAPPPATAPYSAGAKSAQGIFREKPTDERLGTAHGAREWSATRFTDFVRATSYPQWIRQIEYDTYGHLVSRGVIAPAWSPGYGPRPFPTQPDRGFVADPPDEP
ncbi:MAG TPA: hypothetical protein VG166_10635 [Caulobacteraceae bacterium]|nr:hypothetical protein [Caulobacteraceae bacterium]